MVPFRVSYSHPKLCQFADENQSETKPRYTVKDLVVEQKQIREQIKKKFQIFTRIFECKANVKENKNYMIIATTQPTTQNNLKELLLGWYYNR